MPNPPPIDRDLVAYLSELARLRLPEERQDALRVKLTALVEAFSTLDAADFSDLDQAAANRTATPEDLRPDAAHEVPPAADVLRNAPQMAADSFVVPRVVEP